METRSRVRLSNESEASPVQAWNRLLRNARNRAPDTGSIRDLLLLFGDLRSSYGLSAEQVLIYLAIGAAEFDWRAERDRKTSHQCIAHLVGVPKETVRRKIEQLIGLGLIHVTEDGLKVVSSEDWSRLADLLQARRKGNSDVESASGYA